MEVNVQRDYQPLFTLVQPLHTEMADKGALTVYIATSTMFLACCKDSAKSSMLKRSGSLGTIEAVSYVTISIPNITTLPHITVTTCCLGGTSRIFVGSLI